MVQVTPRSDRDRELEIAEGRVKRRLEIICAALEAKAEYARQIVEQESGSLEDKCRRLLHDVVWTAPNLELDGLMQDACRVSVARDRAAAIAA